MYPCPYIHDHICSMSMRILYPLTLTASSAITGHGCCCEKRLPRGLLVTRLPPYCQAVTNYRTAMYLFSKAMYFQFASKTGMQMRCWHTRSGYQDVKNWVPSYEWDRQIIHSKLQVMPVYGGEPRCQKLRCG